MADDPFAQYAVKADDPFAAYAAAPAAPRDAGFLQGVLRTLPTPAHLLEAAKAIPGNIRASFAPDALEQWQARDRTQSPTGKMLHGQPREGAGELLGMLGQIALGEAGVGYLRTKLPAAANAVTVGGRTVPVADLEAAGVGKGSMDIIRNGRPAPSGPRLVTKTPPAEPPPTRGNLALQPEFQPTDTPPAAPPTKTPQKDALSPLRQQELLQKFGGMMRDKGAVIDRQPAVTINPQTAGDIGKLTPEQVAQLPSYSEQMRGVPGNDWRSFAEPGSAEAKSAAGLHKYEGEMASRWKYLMDSENGSISPTLLQHIGLPAKYAGAMFAAKQAGLPAWAGAAGMGGYDLVSANPMASAQAVRAALLARLGAGSTGSPDTGHSR